MSQLKSSKEFHLAFFLTVSGRPNCQAGVKGPKQITDGHLLALAESQGAEMATLDKRIPGAFVIPGKA